jgi:hypothetical protein
VLAQKNKSENAQFAEKNGHFSQSGQEIGGFFSVAATAQAFPTAPKRHERPKHLTAIAFGLIHGRRAVR